MPSKLTKNRIYVDATGIVRWGAQPVVGIPRVELNICEFALDAGSASNINLVIFDKTEGIYRPASPRIREFIAHIAKVARTRAQRRMLDRFRAAFAFFPEQVVYQDYETARRLADAVVGSQQRSGSWYRIAKLILRIGLWTAALPHLATIAARKVLHQFPLQPPTGSTGERAIVLVSHAVNQHPQLHRALRDMNATGAHIVHDLIPIRQPGFAGTRLRKKMEQHLCRVLTASEPIIAISNATRDDLLQWNADEVKANYQREIAVCPLGTQMNSEAIAEEEIPELAGRCFAVYCSTIEVRKNHDFIVAVWRRLATILPPDILPDLVLIGRKTNGWNALFNELKASTKIAQKIHVFHGLPDSQLQWAYRHALLGVFPSSAEGWGLGVSECLANGLPVVISDIPVLHEVTQRLMPSAPARDLLAWTKILGDLFENPQRIEDLRSAISERYRHRPAQEFADDLLSYLQRCLEKS